MKFFRAIGIVAFSLNEILLTMPFIVIGFLYHRYIYIPMKMGMTRSGRFDLWLSKELIVINLKEETDGKPKKGV